MKPSLSFSFLTCLALLPSLHAADEAPLTPGAFAAEVSAHNPELRFYEAELAVARAAVRTASAPADPSLSVSAGRKRTHDSAGVLAGEGTAWSVSLAQTFEWPGRAHGGAGGNELGLIEAELGIVGGHLSGEGAGRERSRIRRAERREESEAG